MAFRPVARLPRIRWNGIEKEENMISRERIEAPNFAFPLLDGPLSIRQKRVSTYEIIYIVVLA